MLEARTFIALLCLSQYACTGSQDSIPAHKAAAPGIFAQQAYLKASNTDSGDNFGAAVAISGDLAVIGAPYEKSNSTAVDGDQADNNGDYPGAAYLFVRAAGSWSQQAYLKASVAADHGSFGYAVAVSGNTVAVGAPSVGDHGSIFVFRNDTGWKQEAQLQATATTGDGLGSRVAVAGDTVVAALGTAGAGTGAHVFFRSVGGWVEQAVLQPGDGKNNGGSVAISGDLAVVGVPFADSEVAANRGAAHIYRRTGTTWSEEAMLLAPNPDAGDLFGCAVGVSGENIIIGADREASGALGSGGDMADNSVPQSGAAYVFTRIGNTWQFTSYLKASDPSVGASFGGSVAIEGDTIVVGAEKALGNGASAGKHVGAAYIFRSKEGTWQQIYRLSASNPDLQDGFGNRVALANSTVLVGANWEASKAVGVNGIQADNSKPKSGAAYVFQ